MSWKKPRGSVTTRVQTPTKLSANCSVRNSSCIESSRRSRCGAVGDVSRDATESSDARQGELPRACSGARATGGPNGRSRRPMRARSPRSIRNASRARRSARARASRRRARAARARCCRSRTGSWWSARARVAPVSPPGSKPCSGRDVVDGVVVVPPGYERALRRVAVVHRRSPASRSPERRGRRVVCSRCLARHPRAAVLVVL